ncbi:MAG: Sua5/YciO/YrdC/YwlC family protein [Nanoarchaeota archaeon]
MRTITPDEFRIHKFTFFKQISKGAVFIHPTDTIYGIGCDATNEAAVKMLRDLKEQQHRPISVIAPDVAWIKEHCMLTKEGEEWLTKLPGPYTIIFKTKHPKGVNSDCIAPSVHLGTGTVGVRMINHWFQDFVKEYGKPIITTSANKQGKFYMTEPEKLDPSIAKGILFFINEGEKKGAASNLIDLSKDKVDIRKR